MGGLLNLFDLNQGNMARKILSNRRRVDGFEAPRNSLELQVEASQSSCSAGDGPNSFLVEDDWSENNCYPIETSMKKLITEEMSKQSHTRKNAPSIVARLMGVDSLPLETRYLDQPIHRSETTEIKFSRKEKNERRSVTHLSRKSCFAPQMEFGSLYNDKVTPTDGDRWSDEQTLGKPRPREHPQEEELQKFKKEFEAWQAARFNECSKFAEFGKPQSQLIAKENINKKKLLLNNTILPAEEISAEDYGLGWKQKSLEQCDLRHHYHRKEPVHAEHTQSLSSQNRNRSRSAEHFLVSYDQILDSSTAPTKIVILKPGPDQIYDHEESWTSSSGTLEDRGGIEDFLEEVKERLKQELQGSTVKRGSLVRGSGIETPFSEKSSNPKQIVRHIAKHFRESVTRDHGANLLRSESTRSYRSEVQFNGTDSPEFMNRDARRFLSERLRNVLRRDSHFDAPPNASALSGPCLYNGKVGMNLDGDASRSGNEPNYWEIVNDEEMQTRSFRHGDEGPRHIDSSPRSLIRSLSAPVSGTSFGKLLLEDRHILTGAQIRRKHESPGNVTIELKKHKKEKLNIKERVSNLRHNFTLKGRLFGKKIQPMLESNRIEQDFAKDFMSGPTAILNLGERHIMFQENSTEVPPSPASVSSAQEELWRHVEYLSAASTPEITLEDDKAMPQFLKDISSNLNELRRQLNQLQSDENDIMPIEQEPAESAANDQLEDKAQVYVRDLLLASGLYNRSFDKNLLRWNTIAKPMNDSVFEELEERNRKLVKNDKTATRDHDEKKVERKIVFDLLNEALSTLLGPLVTKVRLSRRMIASSVLPHLYGRQLLDCVWKNIREYLYPANDKSCYLLENMVARNLASTPWSRLIDDEINDLAKEVEVQILGNIVEEIVKDMHL